MCKLKDNISYAVIMSWAYQGSDEISLLCITTDLEEAKEALQKGIKKEKESSWISDVEPEEIGDECGIEKEYTEITGDMSWCFYETGSHCEKHTDITIFTYDKSKKE